jgi:hypothetical protein
MDWSAQGAQPPATTPKDPWYKRPKILAIIGVVVVLWVIGFVMQQQEADSDERRDAGPTYTNPAPTEPFRVGLVNVTGYYNDASESFTVKLTTNADEDSFQASARTERNISLSLDCTTDSSRLYVELIDVRGNFRKGEWFTARCAASWSYFVGIDMNSAGVIALTFAQEPPQ